MNPPKDIPSKPEDLLKFAMNDKEFVRFLKENNVYKPYVETAKNNEYLQYRCETIENESYLFAFYYNKSYVYHIMPYQAAKRNRNVNWYEIAEKWAKILREK